MYERGLFDVSSKTIFFSSTALTADLIGSFIRRYVLHRDVRGKGKSEVVRLTVLGLLRVFKHGRCPKES